MSDDLAQAVWCAVSALWHPSLLARAAGLPRIESVDSPSPPGAREIRVIASGAGDRLPSGYKTQAEDARTALARVGHRPRRLDPPDPEPAGSRRGPGNGRERRDDHHGARFPGSGDSRGGCSAS